MAHVSKQLLDAVMAQLADLPTTGANVFRNRPDGRPLRASELPALLVYLGGEDVEQLTVDALMYERRQRVIIGLRVKSALGSDDTLSQMRSEVETVLSLPLAVGPTAERIRVDYNGIADPEFDGDSEQPIASVEMQFSARMFTTGSDTLS